MILKIQRVSDAIHWWIIDGICEIHISPVAEFKRTEIDKLGGDFRFLDVFFLEDTPGTTKSDNANYRQLLCRLSNDKEISIVFDTVAYLCNDNGKTIEKIKV